ncbi:MAG: hypothetical protein ABJA57_04545 [Ginsengibacter sp.]
MNDLSKIFSGSNKDLDNQKLIDYLNGNLTEDEKHELESQIADSELLNDAVEGLEHFKNSVDIGAVVGQLNANLRAQIEKKNLHKKNRAIKNQPWVYLAIIVILSIIIICFIVIKKHLDNEQMKVLKSAFVVWSAGATV